MPITATYNMPWQGDPDRVRYMLGDTETTAPLLDDGEIASMLSLQPFNEAVAQLAEGLAVRFAQEPDKYDADGGLSQSWTQRVDAWFKLAERMRSVVMVADAPVPRSGVSGGTLKQPDASNLRF